MGSLTIAKDGKRSLHRAIGYSQIDARERSLDGG
jgi:hypothetical protein